MRTRPRAKTVVGMTSTREPATRTTLTARSPEDLLAAVPVVLGFHPERSVVMMTFGVREAFHARVDLPDDDPALEEVARCLLEPVRRHRVPRVVFVLYCDDATRGRRTARRLVRRFTEAGVDVVEVLRVAEGRWFLATGSGRGVPEWGVPYDVSAHPFAARAVVDGQVTRKSRAALAATVAADGESVARVQQALHELGDAVDAHGAMGLCEVAEWMVGHTAAGTAPDDQELARVLISIRDPEVRDAGLAWLDRRNAVSRTDLWTDVLRRTPEPLVPAPAVLLALSAWVAGDGALAWCALERCLAADPDYPLAHRVAELLERAIPPSAWVAAGPTGPWGH